MGVLVVEKIDSAGSSSNHKTAGSDYYDVVVVGAGTVGMAVALALHQAQFSVALVDHNPCQVDISDAASSKWFALGSDLLFWFKKLGFNLSYQPITHLALSCQDQAGTITLDAAEAGEPFLTGVIGSRILQSQGRALCEPIDRFFSRTITQWHDEQSLWQLDLSDGQELAVHHLKTPLVIGADGGNSGVRAFFDPVIARFDFRQKASVFRLHSVPVGWSYEHFFPNGSLAVLSLDDGKGAGIWIGKEHQVGDHDAIQSMIQMDLGLDSIISDVSGTFDICGHWVSKKCFHRAVLIGDAAHAIHPIAGQGLNLGLRNGRVLVDHLIQRRHFGLDWGLGLGSLRHSWGVNTLSMQWGTSALVGALCGSDSPWWWSLGRTVMQHSWARTWLIHTAAGKMMKKNPFSSFFRCF
jgi:2-polyprenyl-6-methoxyphenol hydroxylase-like FAD-dependent oxidoreductase